MGADMSVSNCLIAMRGTILFMLVCHLIIKTTSASTTEDGFLTSCNKYFYKESAPSGFPDGLQYICQRYEGAFYFATLYDKTNRIPVYSAYKVEELECEGSQPSRRDSWFIEPELAGRDMQADMDTDKIADHKWTMPAQAINDDYKDTDMDRGHLNPNFMHCGSGRTATFSLTNSVPQDPCMNRIVWYGKESELKKTFEERCAYPQARRYVVTGAVPSPNDFIPHRDLIIDDRPDKVPERVNVPSHMWTAACCDVSDVNDNTAKPFFSGYVAENKAGGVIELFSDVDGLSERVGQLYNHTVQILADACSQPSGNDGGGEVFG